MTRSPFNINYVTNDAILSSGVLDLSHTEYVAIGQAKISGPSFWARLRRKLSLLVLTAI
jgi:hypothetical protein